MPQITYRQDYQKFPFVVPQCKLSFEILNDCVIVSSEIQFTQNPQYKGPPQNCTLDGVDLTILGLELDGQVLKNKRDYHYEAQKLELLGTDKKTNFIFAAKVKIDPYNNKSLEGMYRSGKILCTQNEATGFRHITFYPDRPDVMSHFVTKIVADKERYPRLLSNGNLLESKDLDSDRHYAHWDDPFPKPAYLYALVAGDLDLLSDSFTTCSGRQINLAIYTDKGKTAGARHAMASLKKAMKWDEQRFGREYDLDLYMIVAVDSFNFGAMENKGLNIFNSSLVFATEATATDTTYENIATTIAHEYFHNWTGNRITCRDWFQLTLKEGLTVYRDELFSEDNFDREVCRLQQVSNLRDNQYPEDKGPNRHPIRPDSFIDINNFYTQTVYQKGAAVIRMLASYLGQAAFRQGMDHYFECFDGKAVTCENFLTALQEGSGKDLSPFHSWYEQAGTPQLYVNSQWDGREFLLHLRQENCHAATSDATSEKKNKNFPPLSFPLPLALYHPQSGQKLREDNILLSEVQTTLRYELPVKPVPSLLLDHISPVEVHYHYSDNELLLLLAAEQDPFNRYEAAQKYLQKILLTADANLSAKYVEQIRTWLACACDDARLSPRALDDNARLSPRYLDQLLKVPSLQILAAAQVPPQFNILQQRRVAHCRELAARLEHEMLSCYMALARPKYEHQELAKGQRALRNTLLHYLCHLDDTDKYHDLAYRQYQNCDNMTDSFAALQALTCWPGAHSETALKHFCQRWQDDFLVLCRWFSLQAGVPRPETLENIIQLEKHALFQRENPNMLRALYSMLGHNLYVFHYSENNRDWPAYQFLAQRILQIDSFNSMMAAGLAKSFMAYKFLNISNQQAMAQALNTILQRRGLSDRLYEIASKTLSS